MTHRAIKPSGAPSALAAYSPGIDIGSLVFVAGQIGLDPSTGQLVEGGIEAQAERVMHNLLAVLDAAGLTMADVVKTTCFLADIADFDAFNAVYARFVSDPPPARSTFAVAALPRGARVEVEAIAART
ncbi:MAG TPA: Rid family detoxifying hydrolase [Candidatus Limnocylindrales bacterium]|jgi:2-iminobutanoate/2-iminopropanoate deaminase|nr:Rid family detoxifying hydrolase [Candidatus Limnocylindrales bacterium]